MRDQSKCKSSFKIPYSKPKLEAFVSFDGEEVDLDSIPDRSLTLKEYKSNNIRANTPGWNALLKKYNNETLTYVTNNYLANCSHKNDITYDGALQYRVVPELLNRLQGDK